MSSLQDDLSHRIGRVLTAMEFEEAYRAIQHCIHELVSGINPVVFSFQKEQFAILAGSVPTPCSAPILVLLS